MSTNDASTRRACDAQLLPIKPRSAKAQAQSALIRRGHTPPEWIREEVGGKMYATCEECHTNTWLPAHGPAYGAALLIDCSILHAAYERNVARRAKQTARRCET